MLRLRNKFEEMHNDPVVLCTVGAVYLIAVCFIGYIIYECAKAIISIF